MAPERIELTTSALLARRSNQLSYGAKHFDVSFATQSHSYSCKCLIRFHHKTSI